MEMAWNRQRSLLLTSALFDPSNYECVCVKFSRRKRSAVNRHKAELLGRVPPNGREHIPEEGGDAKGEVDIRFAWMRW
jgi:hypothetical protein